MNAFKIEAARAALAEVRAGMKLGLGTGSTSVEMQNAKCKMQNGKTATDFLQFAFCILHSRATR